MRELLILTKFFLKELMYRKVFLVSIGIGLSFIVLSFLLGPLSYSEESRLSINFSLSGSQIALILLSVMVGSSFIKADILEKSLHLLLARPVSRFQYFFSKFLAFAICLFFLTSLMWFVFFIISLLLGLEVSLNSAVPFLGIYIESLILYSVAVLISIFSSSLLTVGASFTFFLVGHWIEVLNYLSEKAKSVLVKSVGWTLSHVFPNLESLNWKAHLTYEEWLPLETYFKFSLYGVSWVFVLVLVGYFFFNRKDIT